MEERKTERVVIPYFEKGVLKEKEFVIKFISNSVNRDYRSLVQDAYKVSDEWEKIKMLTAEMESMSDADPKEREKALDRITVELNNAEKEITKHDDNDFFEKRVALLKRILNDNGYTDEFYTSIKFWDDMVEPLDIVSFLSRVVHKDADLLKKKAVAVKE